MILWDPVSSERISTPILSPQIDSAVPTPTESNLDMTFLIFLDLLKMIPPILFAGSSPCHSARPTAQNAFLSTIPSMVRPKFVSLQIQL